MAVEVEAGKTLIIKLLAITEPDEEGECTVYFELNGQPRELKVPDRSLKQDARKRPKAEAGNDAHVGAPMPGLVVSVAIEKGKKVKSGERLLSLEAMKMETTVYADRDGVVDQTFVKIGDYVDTRDLLFTYEA